VEGAFGGRYGAFRGRYGVFWGEIWVFWGAEIGLSWGSPLVGNMGFYFGEMYGSEVRARYRDLLGQI